MIVDIGKVATLLAVWDDNTSEKLVKPIVGVRVPSFTNNSSYQPITLLLRLPNSPGNVVVTTHLYDGKKSVPLDIELYQHATSLPEGKKDREFKQKPEIALSLIDKAIESVVYLGGSISVGMVLCIIRKKKLKKLVGFYLFLVRNLNY